MIAYKVVRVKDKPRWWQFWKRPKLVSAIASGPAEVEYKKGEWAKAPRWLARGGYHLTAFRGKSGAQFFMDHEVWDDAELWLCDTADFIYPLPPIASLVRLREGEIQPVLSVTTWPSGDHVIMAEHIKLLERIV